MYPLIFLKGMLMGIADLIPGVSGGTIALITGIYQRLITAIAAVNKKTFENLFRFRIKAIWSQLDGWFLLALFAGIITSIILFSSLIKQLLEQQPIPTWSFFFGLILASAILLLAQQKKFKVSLLLLLFIGIAISYTLSQQALFTLPNNLLGIFVAGAIAICAMILPGLSGSLLLILLGKYQTMLTAIAERDLLTLGVFVGGIIIGLLTFSKLLKWLMAHHYQAMIYFLSGLMLGTLFKIWPWKIGSNAVMPWQISEPQLLLAIMMMSAAGIFIMLLNRFEK